MPNPIADLNSYKLGVDTDVTTKSTINSITPVDVGGIGTILADVLLPYLQSINNQGYSQGTGTPSNLVGADLDLYYQQLVGGFRIWRKQNGIWVEKVTMIFVIVEDGIQSGLRTYINGNIVTVSSGTWSIDNVRYSKATQTQFTVPAADANYTRYDLIYADNTGAIGYTNGVASTTPAYPTPAAGQILVDYVVVPSVASGDNPYLLSGGGAADGATEVLISATSTGNEFDASGYNLRSFPFVVIYDINGIQSPAQYDNTNEKFIGLNDTEAFTARVR